MKRTGFFKMHDSILFNESLRGAVHAVFTRFIPLDVELSVQGYRKYYGYCEDFDEVSKGSPWPEYECLISEDNAVYTLKFQKI